MLHLKANHPCWCMINLTAMITTIPSQSHVSWKLSSFRQVSGKSNRTCGTFLKIPVGTWDFIPSSWHWHWYSAYWRKHRIGQRRGRTDSTLWNIHKLIHRQEKRERRSIPTRTLYFKIQFRKSSCIILQLKCISLLTKTWEWGSLRAILTICIIRVTVSYLQPLCISIQYAFVVL